MKINIEPVRTVLLPIVLAAAVAALQAFVTGENTRGIILAVLSALVLAGQEYARGQVTPVAKLEDEQKGPLRDDAVAG